MGKKYQKSLPYLKYYIKKRKSEHREIQTPSYFCFYFNTNGSQSTVSFCFVSADVTIGVDTTAATGATDA